MEELSPLHNRWEELAHALSPSLDLEAIKAHSHSGDELHETLRRWLDTGDQLWVEVLLALRKVGEDDVANKLKVKYGELATTVVSLTLFACGSMGNCGVELIWLGECNSTQLHLALRSFVQPKAARGPGNEANNSYYLAFFPDPSPSGKKNCCTNGKQLGGLQGMWLASGY